MSPTQAQLISPMPPATDGTYPETLPATCYGSDSVFALERTRIFRRSWFLLARTAQFAEPGSYVAGDVWGMPVVVIANRDRQLNGFLNCCRHRAGRLFADGDGRCNGAMRCTYHGWRYDLDGRLVLAPGFTKGGDFDPAEFGLFPVRVETWNGMVFVALDPDVESLIDWLGDIVTIGRDYPGTDQLSFLRTVELEGAANWKLYGENGVEGYHLAFVHTWLLQAVGANAYEVNIHENGKFVGFPVEYQTWGLERAFKGYWILKYPGLLVHFSEIEFNCEQVIPLGVRRTGLKHFFWVPPDRPAIAENITRDWRITMQEDMGVCEAVQRNLDGGVYQNGRLTPARERGAIYFQSLVRNAIGDAVA